MKLDSKTLLNDPQLEAVETLEGPLLIIAGAGSGKTRVITYRIAKMLDSGIPQHAILALTFTNKAAREMESRVKELTGKKLQSLTISTFHAFGVKILRGEIETLGYRSNFSIYDETDRYELIKETLRECRIKNKSISIYSLGQLFSNIKTGRFSWHNAPAVAGSFDGSSGSYQEGSQFEQVYEEYQKSLKIFNALDFDDLLVLPIEIFKNNPDVLEKYRSRYRYIMVDEFQDTSLIQYRLMRLLALGAENEYSKSPKSAKTAPNNPGGIKQANVCVVGDDDQSIYSWRGANYENLLMFEKDFPGAKVIKLEQNYRSTATILEAANGLISHNKNRKEKNLWSGKTGGRPIELFYPENENEEGTFITEKINEHKMADGLGFDAFGVLLRTNSLIQNIEMAFRGSNIPYIVSGGMSFFQRKEIKDVIAYLKLIANTNDDINLLRIINIPRRGIGKSSIQTISELARRNKTYLWDAMEKLCRSSETPSGAASALPSKTRSEINVFMNMIDTFRDRFFNRAEGQKKQSLAENVRQLVDRIGYWPYLAAEFSKKEKIARWRFANINYFIEAIESWEKDPDNLDSSLYAWLNRVSLINSSDDRDEEKGKVNLMTIHAAKGLEFPVVFIAGAEEGIIPHTKSLEDGSPEYTKDGSINESSVSAPLEEERRLFYVAITRAREKLYITSCKTRRRFQEITECAPSPFLPEIPPHLMETPEKNENNPHDMEMFFARMKEKFK